MGQTFGDDQCLELALLRCALHDARLDRVSRDQAEDQHGLGLADAVRAVLRLHIHLGVLPSQYIGCSC